MNTPTADRVIDLDVTRAVALIGVAAMNYHGYLIGLGGPIGESAVNRFFNPWTGPLSTRFAATFVMIAGMGITLMTNRGRVSGDRQRRSLDRWTLIRRGFLLYAFGFVFEWVWNGTILFFYGAYFMVGAFLFTLRIRWLIAIGSLAAIAAAALQWWAFETDHNTQLAVRGLVHVSAVPVATTPVVRHVRQWHPSPPAMAGLPVRGNRARSVPPIEIDLALGARRVRRAARRRHVSRSIISSPTRRCAPDLLATDPFSRSLNYTVCALGSSITAFCVIGWIANTTRSNSVTQGFAAAGRTTLTLYVLHVLVFNAAVTWWHLIHPAGLDVALAFAAGFWIVGIIAAVLWQRWFGIGPAEWVYRKFGGSNVRAGTYRTSLNVSHCFGSPEL